MTIQAAKDLKAGKEIGRISYYRPDITIKKTRYLRRKMEIAPPCSAAA
jgi:hypothetical protein